MPWCALVFGIQPPYLGIPAGMLHSGYGCLEAGLDSPRWLQPVQGAMDTCPVDFLLGFSACCPGCCFWRVWDVLGKVHGNRRAQGEQIGLLLSSLGQCTPPLIPALLAKGKMERLGMRLQNPSNPLGFLLKLLIKEPISSSDFFSDVKIFP